MTSAIGREAGRPFAPLNLTPKSYTLPCRLLTVPWRFVCLLPPGASLALDITLGRQDHAPIERRSATDGRGRADGLGTGKERPAGIL